MATLLSADELAGQLATLKGWSGDAGAITRTVELPSFVAAVEVVNQVAHVAEAMNHHPDMDIRYNKLTFICSTHTAGGVTDLDAELAGRINEIVPSAAA